MRNIIVQFRKQRFLKDIYLIVFTASVFGVISYFLKYVQIDSAPLLFGILFFIAWPWLWRFFCVLFFRQPALVINRVGIQLFPVHLPSNFLLNWSEIQKISIEQQNSESCMCIYLKQKREYLLQLPFFKRLMMRLWNLRGQAFMSLSLSYLDSPIIEIFQQVFREYGNELKEYSIQLQL
ncbi:MAG TPA: STM3941 family protein [Ktedonobacteraceae bacterium]|nr:STM3941 family protein [Ktedonobacteraceae bacterium]